jgi:hypothetical protein
MTRSRILLAALPFLAAAQAASADSFTGNYLMTLNTTHPAWDTETHCLSLVDDGSVLTASHGGDASIADYIDGQFMVASHQLIATLGFHGVSFTLTAPLNAANAGPGSFVALNDGAIVSRGVFILGGKGSCAPP